MSILHWTVLIFLFSPSLRHSNKNGIKETNYVITVRSLKQFEDQAFTRMLKSEQDNIGNVINYQVCKLIVHWSYKHNCYLFKCLLETFADQQTVINLGFIPVINIMS